MRESHNKIHDTGACQLYHTLSDFKLHTKLIQNTFSSNFNFGEMWCGNKEGGDDHCDMKESEKDRS
jgi:hypothetical protein